MDHSQADLNGDGDGVREITIKRMHLLDLRTRVNIGFEERFLTKKLSHIAIFSDIPRPIVREKNINRTFQLLNPMSDHHSKEYVKKIKE
jgi:hypothetical protein